MAIVMQVGPARGLQPWREDRIVIGAVLVLAVGFASLGLVQSREATREPATGVCERPIPSTLGYVFLTMH
jgi:hypothetical protein